MDRKPLKLPKGPFTLIQAKKLGISRHHLKKLVFEGLLEQIARGVYRTPKVDMSEEDQFKVATLLVGTPCAICLLSALSYYGLTDMIPKKTWIMVPASKRTRHSDLKLLRTRNPRWQIGIEKSEGHSITTLERTIVDALCARVRIGSQVAMESLRKAIQSKKTTPGKVMDMAKKLGVVHRVLPYLEVLS